VDSLARIVMKANSLTIFHIKFVRQNFNETKIQFLTCSHFIHHGLQWKADDMMGTEKSLTSTKNDDIALNRGKYPLFLFCPLINLL